MLRCRGRAGRRGGCRYSANARCSTRATLGPAIPRSSRALKSPAQRAHFSLRWTTSSTLPSSPVMLSAARFATPTGRAQCRRLLATTAPTAPSASSTTSSEPLTHYRITLRRSAISLPQNIKGTLEALGIHRRLQTVYHRHTPDIAGKILTVKELVTVENVPESAVRTKWEQRQERKAPRGYSVTGSKLQSDL